MIEKIPKQNTWGQCLDKINELVDAVNALIKENNIHEKQIDELQMNVEPHKCEPAENTIMAKNANVAENGKCAKIAQDPYTEQRRWIGKLCKFWDFVYDHYYFDTLKGITDKGLFIGHNGSWEHCEPVKPDDDIIYKGK